MKTIIVGADGFVGQNISRRRKIPAHFFDSGFLHQHLKPQTEFADITGDMTKLEDCMKGNEGAFKVLNLAAIHHIPYCNEHPDDAVFVNVYGNMRLFELAVDYGCKHYIFASSGAVYRPENNQHAENDPRRSSDVYSATKILAEDYLAAAALSHSLPVTSLRFFNIIGEYDITPHLVPDIVDQIMGDGRCVTLGNLTTVRDYIGVGDICDVIEKTITAKTSDLYSVFNVGTGQGYTGLQVFNLINKLTGNDKPLIQDPKRFRVSDRPSQISDPKKLNAAFNKTEFAPLTKSLSEYLSWRKLL